MKTNTIKDVVIGVFAIIGFYVVLTGFNSPQADSQVISASPESHKWELVPSGETDAYLYNKVTGETYGFRRRELGDNWAKVEQLFVKN